MKRSLSVLLSLALLCSLTACGGGAPAGFDPAADVQALLEAPGAFSDQLTPIDQSTACALYGIDEAGVTASAVYGSTGASAEELALFTFVDETAAQAAGTQLRYRVEDQKEALERYLPHEMDKLDKAVVEVRGASALLVIAADYAPVTALLTTP